MKLELQAGIRVETVGNDAIVLDRSGVTFHHAVGDAAEVLRRVTSGEGDIDLPSELLPAVAALTEAGVLVPTGLSRRMLLLKGGVGVAAAGLTSFALATPAAAASLCPGNVTPDGTKTFTAAGTYIPAPGISSVVVRAWGGGGGGGRGSSSTSMSVTTNLASSGGGGGAFNQNLTVAVTECVSYSVTYSGGTGGVGASMDAMAGDPGVALTVTLNSTSVTANGGSGGDTTGGAGGMGTFAGGVGASRSGTTSGGGGGGAGSGAAGTAGSGASGGAGGTGTYPGGAGGAGGSGVAGDPGSPPGGGGGGGGISGTTPANGGQGAAGQAVIAVS